MKISFSIMDGLKSQIVNLETYREYILNKINNTNDIKKINKYKNEIKTIDSKILDFKKQIKGV